MNTSRNVSLWRVLGLSLVIAGLVGCNTMEGAGRDLNEAGEAIEDEAAENNDYTE